MDFLRWVEGLRAPLGNFFFDKITLLGGETVFMVIAIIVFWCINKKWGYFILTVGFFGTLLNQFLKLLFRIPRPWVLDPNLTIVESARADAGGYSFPSGHTQNAVGTFGGLAVCSKKLWAKISCVLLALLVPFSRMYLGVHTPLDVGVAFLCAIAVLLIFYPLVIRSEGHPKRMYVLFGLMLVASLAYILYVNFTLHPAEFGEVGSESFENYRSGVKNGWSLTGALLGLIVTWFHDERKQHFVEKAPFLGQVCKVVLGLAVVIAIRLGLSKLFGLLFPDQLFWTLPRYFLMVLFAGCIWPKSFPFWQRLGKKEAA